MKKRLYDSFAISTYRGFKHTHIKLINTTRKQADLTKKGNWTEAILFACSLRKNAVVVPSKSGSWIFPLYIAPSTFVLHSFENSMNNYTIFQQVLFLGFHFLTLGLPA